MKIINAKPTSPGRRFFIYIKNNSIYKKRPYKKLVVKKNNFSGRNNKGRLTVRHKGGGHKNLYRIIDFKRSKDNIVAKVERIEYDPNRTANIALVLYKDGERRYILAPNGLKKQMLILSGKNNVPIKIGNAMPLNNIPIGTFVHNIELKPGKGAQIARSAGTSVQIVGKDKNYSILRLQSGEMRKILLNSRAVIGAVSNVSHNLCSIGKAGRNRWKGIRPTVRGVAMNPVDHPHGGGEGKTSGGRHPVNPCGVQTKGKRTRKINLFSSKLILKRRIKN